MNGMASHIALIPEDKLGIVVLTNCDATFFPEAMSYAAIEQFLGSKEVPPYPWQEHFFKLDKEYEAQEKARDAEMEAARILGTKPTLTLRESVGTYENDLYGPVAIEQKDQMLLIRMMKTEGTLEHWHYDTFCFIPKDPLLFKSLVTFRLNSDGSVEAFCMPDTFELEVFEKR